MGFRIIARKDSKQVTLYDRQGNDLTQRFPLIVGAMAELPPCTIDGEAVTCDDSWCTIIRLLRSGQRAERAFLCAFPITCGARE
jgi:ATP-dependent DNA ligase